MTPAVELAVRHPPAHLTQFLDHQRQISTKVAARELEGLIKLTSGGSSVTGFLTTTPGFSIIALESDVSDDLVVVEFHGFHNESTASRMHVEFTGEDNPRWYSYWTGQFEHIWENARAPGSPPDDRRTTQAPPQTA